MRVYQYSSGSWSQLGADIDGEASGDHSGFSVSMNSTGDRVAIGGIYNDGNGSDAGHVRVYQYSSGSGPSSATSTGKQQMTDLAFPFQ